MQRKTIKYVPMFLCILLATLPVFADHHEAAGDKDGDAPKDASKEKAMAVLEAADAATRAVEAASFEGRIEPSGLALNFAQAAEGHGVMAGWNDMIGMPQRFYGVAETTRDGETVKLEGGGDGETFYIIDHATKKGYEDMDPGVMGTIGNALRGIGMIEMVHPTPFADELGSDDISYLGTEEVEGVLCDKVNVVYSGGLGESTWYISQEDHLPRRRVRHFNTPQGDGTIVITMSELDVEPKIDASKFKMSLPEGYEAIDDFAP